MITTEQNKFIVGDFQLTGANKVNVALVCKKWNSLWSISQWSDPARPSYRLIKMVRKNSENTSLKTQISKEQALEIINKRCLQEHKSEVFRYGSTWK